MECSKSFYFGYKLFGGNLETIPTGNQIVINTINQYSFCIADKDKSFKKALLESDLLLPDGIAVVWSNYLLNNQKVRKISGADLHDFLLNKLNKEHGKCFYLGASDSTLGKIQKRLQKEYPNVQFSSFSPPYKSEFSKDDTLEMIEKINAFYPDVLFVGMTAPKQEKWVNENRGFINANVICSIGAVFDFYAGTIERPNKVFIGLGLEWFGRFLNEPRRMWKRYFYFGPVFLYWIFMEKMKLALTQKVNNYEESLG
jgi:N-acetylglucosaminyldiphosphoundecaprenol N-acetyl-beta-D-mannosaminyltransferase